MLGCADLVLRLRDPVLRLADLMLRLAVAGQRVRGSKKTTVANKTGNSLPGPLSI